MLRLFDTHCHINSECYEGQREEVIDRMHAAGIELAVVVADGSREDMELTMRLCRENEFLYAATGLHPEDATKWSEQTASRLQEELLQDKVVALGEIGLDYHWKDVPPEVQKDVFAAQLDLAYSLNKPVILHIREAYQDSLDICMSRWRSGKLPDCVCHCYSGSWESAKTFLEMGMYISISGTVTYKNAHKLPEIVKKLPLDRLLVETDSPYLAPVPHRGQTNEPAFVECTARCVAQLRDMDPEDLAWTAMQNGMRFFRIPAEKVTRPACAEQV